MTRADLTPELLALMECEKVIEQGLATFVDVGYALARVRDEGLYGAKGFETFERYCRERWDMSRPRAYQMIDAARVVDLVSTVVDTEPPKSERVVRELAPLRDDPERMRAVWSEANERATNGHGPTAELVRELVHVSPISKPDVGGGVSHPARYSDGIVEVFADLLPRAEYPLVLDPFAGTGRIHELSNRTIGIEIEREWAALKRNTIHGDARDVRKLLAARDVRRVDAIATSPAYGNRLADHHDASDPERRRSYTHDLGHELTEGNAGAMQWHPGPEDDEYRVLHRAVWGAVIPLLRKRGRFVLNMKDHVRGGEIVPVTLWHVATLVELGLHYVTALAVDARNLRSGANAELRCPEWIVILEKKG